MDESSKQSRWTWFYENIWLSGAPEDWRILAAVSALSFLLAGFFIYLLAQGEANGLPQQAHLRELQGAVKTVTRNKYDVEFQLAPWKTVFEYPSKARALADVATALREGGEATVLVDGSKFADGEEKRATIFGLALNGKVIRSFDDVDKAWRADNRNAIWLVGAFVPIALALAATALYEYRRRRS
jgi:hypothetical protein